MLLLGSFRQFTSLAAKQSKKGPLGGARGQAPNAIWVFLIIGFLAIQKSKPFASDWT